MGLAVAIALGMGGMMARVTHASGLQPVRAPSPPPDPMADPNRPWVTKRGHRVSAAQLKRAAKKRRMARARASKRRAR
jgi:hypothetical protein